MALDAQTIENATARSPDSDQEMAEFSLDLFL
jgi:hypothetical protein